MFHWPILAVSDSCTYLVQNILFVPFWATFESFVLLCQILYTVQSGSDYIIIGIYLINFNFCVADIASNTIRIYADKTRRVQLPYEKTLEDCGYHGKAEWYQPTDLTLYYDYDCDYFDCPILVSDYYFINRKRQATTTNWSLSLNIFEFR